MLFSGTHFATRPFRIEYLQGDHTTWCSYIWKGFWRTICRTGSCCGVKNCWFSQGRPQFTLLFSSRWRYWHPHYLSSSPHTWWEQLCHPKSWCSTERKYHIHLAGIISERTTRIWAPGVNHALCTRSWYASITGGVAWKPYNWSSFTEELSEQSCN